MLMRTAAGLLWFFASWMIGGVVALATGVPGWMAPLIGVAVGAFVAADPIRLMWAPRPKRAAVPLGRSSVLLHGGHAPNS
jgi:hypothetical protein